jgi:hypothetical protein
MNTQTKAKGLFPPYNAPPHQPRHELQDGLYWLVTEYRIKKPVSPRTTAALRRDALAVIRQIKGACNDPRV